MGACRRPIRFILSPEYFNHPLLRYILKIMRAIPSDLSEQSLQNEIKETLDKGGLIGVLMPVNPKIESILQQFKAPVIPMKLEKSPLLQFPGHPIVYKVDIVADAASSADAVPILKI
jgi:hypothetical protein